MPFQVEGRRIRIDCDDRAYADTVLRVFTELKSDAKMRFVDDSAVMNAGSGFETITILAGQAYLYPVLAAATLAAGIAAGEIVKEASKDVYKAVKAAVRNCLRIAGEKPAPSEGRLHGFQLNVFPYYTQRPARMSFDITFETSAGRGKPVRVSDRAIDEAFWLLENRIAPLLLKTKSVASPSGRRTDLQIDPEGEIRTCCVSMEFDQKHINIHASREGIFLQDREGQKCWLTLEDDSGLMISREWR